MIPGGRDGARRLIDDFFSDESVLFRVQCVYDQKNKTPAQRRLFLDSFYAQFSKKDKQYLFIDMSKKRAEALFKREKERQATEAEEKQKAFDAEAARR